MLITVLITVLFCPLVDILSPADLIGAVIFWIKIRKTVVFIDLHLKNIKLNNETTSLAGKHKAYTSANVCVFKHTDICFFTYL